MKNQSLKNSIKNKNEKTKSERQGLLKILVSKQMLSRLPITLAHKLVAYKRNKATIAFFVLFKKKTNQKNL